MNSIYFCLFVICLSWKTSKASSSKKEVVFEIDEFIKQLMDSEKFEELTNIVVAKAVQKMRDMDIQGTNHDKQSALRQLENDDNDGSKSSEKPNYDRELVKNKDNSYKKETSKSRSGENFGGDPDYETSHKKYAKSEEKFNKKRDNHEEKELELKENSKLERDTQKQSSQRLNDKHSSNSNKHKGSKVKTGDGYKNNYDIQKNNEHADKSSIRDLLKNNKASKEITLNYKHLKGEVEKHRFDIKGNNWNPEKDLAQKEGKNMDGKADSKEALRFGNAGGKNEHEQSTFHEYGEEKQSKENYSNDKNAEKRERPIKIYKRESNDNPVPRMKDSSKKSSSFSEDNKKGHKSFVDKILDRVSQEFKTPYTSREVEPKRSHSDVSGARKDKSMPRRKSFREVYRKKYDSSPDHDNYLSKIQSNLQPKYFNTK